MSVVGISCRQSVCTCALIWMVRFVIMLSIGRGMRGVDIRWVSFAIERLSSSRWDMIVRGAGIVCFVMARGHGCRLCKVCGDDRGIMF